MGFQISPGVNVSEIDLTTIIPAVSTTTGAFAGHYNWGPVGTRVLVDSEETLNKTFSVPDGNTAVDFFTAANFLAYGNSLYTVRVINEAGTASSNTSRARNATTNAANTKNTIIKSEDDYDNRGLSTSGISDVGNWVAKYPGELGNNLRVSVCLTANAYESTLDGTITRGDLLGGTSLSSANSSPLSISVFTVTTNATGFLTSLSANTKTVAVSANLVSQININDYLIFPTRGGNTQRKVTARSYTGANSTTQAVSLTLEAGASRAGFTNGTILVTAVRYGSLTEAVTGQGTITFSNNSTTVTSTANLASQLTVGDILVAGPDRAIVKIGSISTSGKTITLQSKYVGNTTTAQVSSTTRRWEFFDYVSGAPGTSEEAAKYGGSGDEMHIAVIDRKGGITGIANTIVEIHPNISKAINARSENGTNIWYKSYMNKNSRWVWWTSHLSGINGGKDVNSGFAWGAGAQSRPLNTDFYHGRDGAAPRAADYINGYNLFKSAESVDVSLVLGGGHSTSTVPIHIINNIVEYRKDCIAIFSPRQADVVNNSGYAGSEVDDIVAFRNSLPSTSYAVLDSGWKYQYDKYSDRFRYVPCNGDTAGTMVRTDIERDPWYSPAGYNRGQIKNVVKLAFNPNKTERDQLYKNGINPITTFPGEGTILFGDKTMLTKPSAFDRINVRRLFIVLEKAIATAAKYTLFEFNDAFTRAQFKALVEPFLRDVQGRRGITDFRVVCDETNNTPEVIDRNEFIGDIYIKPARSINFIQLNFVAVRTGVDFTEIVGKF